MVSAPAGKPLDPTTRSLLQLKAYFSKHQLKSPGDLARVEASQVTSITCRSTHSRVRDPVYTDLPMRSRSIIIWRFAIRFSRASARHTTIVRLPTRSVGFPAAAAGHRGDTLVPTRCGEHDARALESTQRRAHGDPRPRSQTKRSQSHRAASGSPEARPGHRRAYIGREEDVARSPPRSSRRLVDRDCRVRQACQ